MSHYTVFSASVAPVQTKCKASFQDRVHHFYLSTKHFLMRSAQFIQWRDYAQGGFTLHLGRILKIRINSILVESINHNGQVETVEISGKLLGSVQNSTIAESRFKLLKTKSVKEVDVKNISEMSVEEPLQREGHKSQYTAGLNSASYHHQLGKKLKEPGVSPFDTYVRNFSRQIPSHILHIRRVIVSQGTQVRERLAILDTLEAEAMSKVDNESVTYNWWISFNERLSILARASKNTASPNYFTEEVYELSLHGRNVLQLFPHVVALPTIHPQGVFALNRFTFQGIVPAALQRMTNGSTSLSTFIPELINITRGYGSKPKQPGVSEFHTHFVNDAIRLEPEHRRAVETAYFLLTRENSEYDNLTLSDFINFEKTQQRMTRTGEFMWRLTDPENIGSLLALVSQYDANRLVELEAKFKAAEMEIDYMAKVFNEFATEIIKKHNIEATTN